MFEKTLKKPLEFRNKENVSETAIDILQKVELQMTAVINPLCTT